MAGVGELLWDLLPEGQKLGGSPMNVVYHCQAAGIESAVVSAVGTDELGKEIMKEVRGKGISTEYIQLAKGWPTGTVTVKLTDGIPDFTIHENVAWDQIHWNEQLEKLSGSIDAAAFGSLSQRNQATRETLKKFLRNMKKESIRVFDINLRQHFHSFDIIHDSLELSTVLKINDEELPILAGYLKLKGSVKTIMLRLIKLYNLDLIAFTRGHKGSILYGSDMISVMQAPKVKIKDTVGAGDTFTALLIAGMLKEKSLRDIHGEATEAAARVCTQDGGTPEY